jgi:hypothetical protein
MWKAIRARRAMKKIPYLPSHRPRALLPRARPTHTDHICWVVLSRAPAPRTGGQARPPSATHTISLPVGVAQNTGPKCPPSECPSRQAPRRTLAGGPRRTRSCAHTRVRRTRGCQPTAAERAGDSAPPSWPHAHAAHFPPPRARVARAPRPPGPTAPRFPAGRWDQRRPQCGRRGPRGPSHTTRARARVGGILSQRAPKKSAPLSWPACARLHASPRRILAARPAGLHGPHIVVHVRGPAAAAASAPVGHVAHFKAALSLRSHPLPPTLPPHPQPPPLPLPAPSPPPTC